MPVESGLKLQHLKTLLNSSIFGAGGLQTLNLLPAFPADIIDRFWETLRLKQRRSPALYRWADRVRLMLVAAATGESIPGKLRGEPLQRQKWIRGDWQRYKKELCRWTEAVETLTITNPEWLDETLAGLVHCLNIRELMVTIGHNDEFEGHPSNGAFEALIPLTGLRSLRLRDCCQLSDLRPLSALNGLRTLFLVSCEHINNLSPLASLAELDHLVLNNCPEVKDLSPLVNLRKLKTLIFSRCNGISDISPLARMSGLSRLELHDCDSLGDPLPLKTLTHCKIRIC